jgi:DNA repair exonuclease SbcCD ATPase subunit
MIIFKTITWQNLLSTGTNPVTVRLNDVATTLVVGQNGVGKSTMLDALSYALFGKPHRDIKNAQLINSINGNKMVVTCEFSIGSNEFKIVRGLKPSIFEIWQNGKEIDQRANARDFQKFLEHNILKLNHKSFHQVVVLGSGSFIPFMQLSPNHRREVIEDLLDIRVFTTMNQLLKEDVSNTKEELRNVTSSMDATMDKIDLQKTHIREITSLNENQVEVRKNKIKELHERINVLSKFVDDESEGLQENLNLAQVQNKEYNEEKNRLRVLESTYKAELNILVKETKFYTNHDNCPTCSQEIDKVTKKQKFKDASEQALVIHDKLKDVKVKLFNEQKMIDDNEKTWDWYKAQETGVLDAVRSIKSYNSTIRTYQDEIISIQGNNDSAEYANAEYTKLLEKKDTLMNDKVQLLETASYHSVIAEMLKDTGIKTKIIKQYLPVMNQLINHYLQVLDFFVSFHLDDSFKEEIRSRHRDAFNYSSFSEGEKARIDLSLMFTWRHIARLKNSANTNLLIMDEVGDSSLDNDGLDQLFRIIEVAEPNSNVFVISHRGSMDDRFDSKIEFVKDKNFSKIK